jgi:pre-mRNA-processing factor 19
MTSIFCALSGENIQDPVVSKLTGHIFERRVIEKQVDSIGQCPFTHQDMTKNDLIPL